jgi:hypothetical protein
VKRSLSIGKMSNLPELLSTIGLSARNVLGPPKRTPSEATIFVFGQSHAACLRYAWEQRRFRPDSGAMDFKFLLTNPKELVTSPEPGGTDAIPSVLADVFERHAVTSGTTEAWLMSVVRGNMASLIGLFEPDPPFDFVHPDLPDLPLRENVPLMPYDLVMTPFREEAETVRRFFEALPRENVAGIVHLEAPPPIPSQAQVEKSLEQAILRQSMNRPDAAISSPEFLMKLYRCQCDANREACSRANVHYVTPPEGAIDEHGYLRKKAWQGATHASAWYGALALKKIERLVASERQRARSAGC